MGLNAALCKIRNDTGEKVARRFAQTCQNSGVTRSAYFPTLQSFKGAHINKTEINYVYFGKFICMYIIESCILLNHGCQSGKTQ
jgi:hypothetical protein